MLCFMEFPEAGIVKPGDTLILRTSRRLSDFEIENLKQEIRSQLDDSIKLLIVDGVDQVIAVRPA